VKINKHARREAAQLFRLCQVDGRVDEAAARAVIERIAADKPRDYLGTMQQFRRLLQLDEARRTAKIESAKGLSTDLQAGVRASLTRAYGDGLNTSFVEKPELIAGMRIQVGSDVYDGSVRARLAALEKSF